MNKEQRAALEAAGYRLGDAKDFLGLSDAESALVEMRLALTKEIRNLREESKLTQSELGKLLHSSQSRVAKMEAGASDVSLDLLFRGYLAVGGSVVIRPAKVFKTRHGKKILPKYGTVRILQEKKRSQVEIK
ncbi:MAG TPA: helix-turn-helix transcriptional regulator [Gemmataceae bacterium]|jgi:transcriptional regulator with XRE-family HTH domain|nr:helix-turn-helix transcriptional regulator [Gemmataceae bacterium]